MPATLSLEELDQLAGIQTAAPTAAAPKKKQLTLGDLDRIAGIGDKEQPAPEDTDSFIGKILEKAAKGTIPGIAATTLGLVDEGPGDLGTFGNIAAEIGSFIPDALTGALPAKLLAKGLWKVVGKEAAEKLVEYGAKKGLGPFAARSAQAAVEPAALMGTIEAGREAAAGELHPGQIAEAAASGALFGPAGQVGKQFGKAAGLGAEVAAMTLPALAAGADPKEALIHAAGTVGGFKLYNAVARAIGRLKPDAKPDEVRAAVEAEVGKEEAAKIEAAAIKPPEPAPTVATPVNEKLAALADKPTVSRKEYAEAVGAKVGHVPVKELRKAEADAERLKQETVNAEAESTQAKPAEAAQEIPPPEAVEAQGPPVLAKQLPPKWSVYPVQIRERGEMWAVRETDNPRGGGDTLHATREGAEAYAQEARLGEPEKLRRNAAFAEKQKQEAEAKEAAKAEKDNIDGFASGESSMKRGRIVQVLNEQIRSGGKDATRKEHIRRAIKDGVLSIGKNADGTEYLERSDGRVAKAGGGFEENVPYQWSMKAPKTELEYAKHLLAKQAQGAAVLERPPVAGPVAETPTRYALKAQDFKSRVGREPNEQEAFQLTAGSSVDAVISPRIQAARAKLEKSVEEYGKVRGSELGALGTPKVVAAFTRVLRDELGLGYAKFSDYVASIARKFGAAITRAHAALIRDTWNEHRKSNPALDEATDVEPFLKDIPDAPAKIARPDLGVPVQGETAKAGLNVARTIRKESGEPDPQTFKQWDAEADQMIAERGSELTADLIKGTWVTDSAADNRAKINVQTALGKAAAESNDWKDLISAGLHYDAEGTDQARILASRRAIEDMTMPDQQAFFNQRELAKPSPQVKKQILAAEAREAKERAEAPPDAPVKPSKRKTAEQLTEEWNTEVKKLKPKLVSFGHDVDKALRGELDPLAHQAFVRDANALKSSKPDQLYEWWLNSVLSGPATETTNALGSAAHGSWYFTVDRVTDAFLSSIARGLGFKPDGAYFGELKHIAKAMVNVRGKAAANFMQTWRTEMPQFYLTHGLETKASTPHDYAKIAIPGKKGRVIRSATRLMTAVDDWFKTGFAEMERAALSYRQARSEGLNRGTRELDARMDELMNDPASDPYRKSIDSAIRLTLQERTKALEVGLKLKDEAPGLRYLIPFWTTPFNIFKTGVRRSPFGAVKLGTELWKASRSGDYSHISQRVAEQVIAWGATLGLAYMNDPANPFITGGDDKNRPYSIKIGGQWYSYGRIEPFATTVGLLVDGINKIHQGADWFEALKAPFDALAKRVENQTFFAGIADLMKAARYNDATYVLDWATKFPASWIPNLVRAPVRAGTENVPQRRTWGKGVVRADRALQRGLAATELTAEYPRYDLWGRAVPRDGGPLPGTDWITRTLSPVGQKKYVETIGDRMLAKWNAAHPDDPAVFTAPNPYFTEKGKQTYFTDAEYAQYVREAGRLTQQRVIAAQARGAFNVNNPTERDVERLRKIIESSRERIRNSIKRARRRAERQAA